MSSAPPIVHIVDDDKSFRISLGRLVEASGLRSASYESGAQFLAHLPIEEPGCILLDLRMPGLDGLELQDRLAAGAPLLPIVFLTGHGDIETTVRAIKAGAEDFLEKTASSGAVLAAIERALHRSQQHAAEHERRVVLQRLVASLTARESVVFNLIVRGRRNKQVAFEIGTTERTVKAHRRNIMEKLGAQSLAEMVSIAEQLGLLDHSAAPPRS